MEDFCNDSGSQRRQEPREKEEARSARQDVRD